MMKYILVLVFIISIGCSQRGETIPGNVINKEEMTGLLTELHVAQSSLNDRTGKSKSEMTNDDCLEIVLEKHSIKREKFLRSLKFYTENPELLNEMYDSVIVRLNTPSKVIN